MDDSGGDMSMKDAQGEEPKLSKTERRIVELKDIEEAQIVPVES